MHTSGASSQHKLARQIIHDRFFAWIVWRCFGRCDIVNAAVRHSGAFEKKTSIFSQECLILNRCYIHLVSNRLNID